MLEAAKLLHEDDIGTAEPWVAPNQNRERGRGDLVGPAPHSHNGGSPP